MLVVIIIVAVIVNVTVIVVIIPTTVITSHKLIYTYSLPTEHLTNEISRSMRF
jgi:hypothetical protein